MTTAEFARYLSVGADRPITYSAIAERAGVSRREVERAAESARADGYPFIADSRGAWVATSVDELADYEQRLRHRLRRQMVGVRGVRRARAAFAGQMRLW